MFEKIKLLNYVFIYIQSTMSARHLVKMAYIQVSQTKFDNKPNNIH